jgi:hypothetical protein
MSVTFVSVLTVEEICGGGVGTALLGRPCVRLHPAVWQAALYARPSPSTCYLPTAIYFHLLQSLQLSTTFCKQLMCVAMHVLLCRSAAAG